MKSDLEDALLFQIRAAKLPEPKREYRALAPRRFRFDLAWPEIGLLVEVQGGIYSGGQHVRGAGYERDCEKLNEAQMKGYDVLYVTRAMIESGLALKWIETALAIPGGRSYGELSADAEESLCR